MAEGRTCTKCRSFKPLAEFGPDPRGKHGTKARCRPCHASDSTVRNRRMVEERKQRLKDDPEYRRVIRDANLRFKYGFGVDEFDRRLAAQGGCCAICGSEQPGGSNWHVDHDHACCPDSRKTKTCGKCYRGILCAYCNVGLGYFNDSPEALARALTYLTLGVKHG